MKRLSCLALMCVAMTAGAAEDFAYVRAVPAEAGLVVIDVRPAADCGAKSLPGARCLPAADFLGPHNRLPSARDQLWLLGTAGLTGAEDVLVVGAEAQTRDFVAGLLYVAGQRRVRVLTEPVGRLPAQDAAPGRSRGMVREAVFTAPMRDELLVLRDELRAQRWPHPLLLDGRTPEEYWGETARAARGGHLPGAVSLPALQLRGAQNPVLPEGSPVAYAHDALEGFAYLTLLRAGHGVAARLYAEGWAEWAADGALPADAASHPERAQPAAEKSQSPQDGAMWQRAALAAAIALAAFALGWTLRSRKTPLSPRGRGAGGEGEGAA